MLKYAKKYDAFYTTWRTTGTTAGEGEGLVSGTTQYFCLLQLLYTWLTLEQRTKVDQCQSWMVPHRSASQHSPPVFTMRCKLWAAWLANLYLNRSTRFQTLSFTHGRGTCFVLQRSQWSEAISLLCPYLPLGSDLLPWGLSNQFLFKKKCAPSTSLFY